MLARRTHPNTARPSRLVSDIATSLRVSRLSIRNKSSSSSSSRSNNSFGSRPIAKKGKINSCVNNRRSCEHRVRY